ncbi:MAG: galactokinase [Firmicutes bacterium]|nr:galactokinase [Bacillota bacterium]
MQTMEQVNALKNIFIKEFGPGGALIIGRAPGRVNLIGEHTDYNEGYVFPMAIDFQILLAARPRLDQLAKIHAVDYRQTVEFSLAEPVAYDSNAKWSNYLRGVIALLQKNGIRLPGMELAFCGNIPQGAGLSSSAALEVVTAITLQKLAGFSMEPKLLAVLCQRAENEFVGMNCGIMDQFISMMGQRDRALFLDCRSLEYQLIPLELGEYRIVICHSGVKHSLVDSEYNQRRRECETGVSVLAQCYPTVKALRDADLAQLETVRDRLSPIVYRRCQHVITENQRALDSIQALRRGDLQSFGVLMNASHESLREAYEVSCPEIDLLVRLAREVPGVLGSRITGGGFGGCSVTLIAAAAIPEFTKHVGGHYQKETGIEPKFYSSIAAGGAEILE